MNIHRQTKMPLKQLDIYVYQVAYIILSLRFFIFHIRFFFVLLHSSCFWKSARALPKSSYILVSPAVQRLSYFKAIWFHVFISNSKRNNSWDRKWKTSREIEREKWKGKWKSGKNEQRTIHTFLLLLSNWIWGNNNSKKHFNFFF